MQIQTFTKIQIARQEALKELAVFAPEKMPLVSACVTRPSLEITALHVINFAVTAEDPQRMTVSTATEIQLFQMHFLVRDSGIAPAIQGCTIIPQLILVRIALVIVLNALDHHSINA